MGSGGSKRNGSDGSPSSKQKKAQKSGGKSEKTGTVVQAADQVVTAEVTTGGSDANGKATASAQSENIENGMSANQSGTNPTAEVTLRKKDASANTDDDRLRTQSAAKAARRTSFYDVVDAAEILPYLVVGNLASVRNPGFLRGKNVGFILNLTTELEAGRQGRGSLRDGDMEQLHVQIEDDEDEEISGHFEICNDFINKAKVRPDSEGKKKHVVTTPPKTVLVHSHYGLSRTSAIVLAYLMKEKGWSLKEANEHLKKCRPAAKPNDGFVVQLLRYEQELRGTMSMTLKDFYKQP